ncbi:TonB-dependent receptor domain-containing protein [Massilia sp. ZL223]|uniref:TonB-dependent receptor plug domain-containing protein n=1 Tax=Massilia sp. ZL223 TaxID=2824904 RepID=UPI001B8286CA|nr:TonB-dependent receptor [Massilia sp. ZL223]
MKKKLVVKQSVIAVALAIGSTHVVAQTGAQEAPANNMQRVVVTGSNIKRIDGETASPVTVLRREDIKASGANTVRQVLDTLTAFDTGTLRDDGSASSFARGASGASMRGLGKAATLVLVNGRRVSNYAFADGGKEVFVNVDSIPADAVERVEVLKDGASAIYGSDAMAGVINIITRNTFEGVRASASVERNQSHDFGGQDTAAILGGMGNLERDGYNVFANLEAYKRRGYMQSDVIGDYAPWHRQYVSPAFGDPSLFSFPGNLNEPKSATNPTAIRQAVASCPATQRNATGLCTSDLTGITPWSDPAKRLNFFSQARFKLGADLRGFAEASYSRTETTYRSLPYANSAGSPSNWFDGNTKTSQSVPKPKLAVGNPANPFNVPVGIDYRFMDDLDMWVSPSEANQFRLMAGLQGSLANGWEWEAAAGRIGADAKSRDHGAHRTAMPNAVTSGEYKIGGPNSPELLARMFPEIGTDADLSQDFIDAKLTGELMALGGGPLSFAFGGEVRRESMYVRSTDNVVNAEIISRGSLWIDGERTMSAIYGELQAPLTKKLQLDGALRLDKSQGFDAHVSPKLGLRYTVVPQLLVRGTFAGGFRTPNIPETLGKVGLTGFFNSTLDPKRCDTATKIRDILKNGNATDKNDATTAYNSGCLTSIPAMISANRDLKPETSRSATLGFVFEPTKNLNISLDYFQIERRDEIAYRAVSYVLAREDQPEYSSLIVRNAVSDTDRRLADRANQLSPGANLAFPVGNIQSLLLNYENFGKTEVKGIDVDFASRHNLGAIGTLNFSLMNTIALSTRTWDVSAGTYRPNTVGLRGTPRLSSLFSAVWRKGDFTTALRVNRTSKTALNFDETDVATWNEAGCKARIKPTDDLPCYRKSDMRADLNVAYTGIKDLRLSLNIRNLFLESAPVDLRGGYALRPRSVKLSAEYLF